MEGDTENCTTCGPNGLKFSRHNGRGRVEVPEDFLADKLGSIDAQIAEGMAIAERLAAARQKRETAPATRPQASYQPPEPSASTHTAGNFTFDALTMTAETQQGAPSGESQRPRGNQFTLAETEHASLLGIGPPPGPPTTTQFNIAESGAADVFPALFHFSGTQLSRIHTSPQDDLAGLTPVSLCPPETKRLTTFVTIALREQLYHGWINSAEDAEDIKEYYRSLLADLEGRPPRETVANWLQSDTAMAALEQATVSLVFPECKLPCQPIIEFHGILPYSSRSEPYVESRPATQQDQDDAVRAGAKVPTHVVVGGLIHYFTFIVEVTIKCVPLA